MSSLPGTKACALAAAAALAGCIGTPLPSGYYPRVGAAPLERPVQERQRDYYRGDPSLLARETGVLILEDRSQLKHGREVEWYESGQVRAERQFAHGEPVGTWRTYYPDGSPESLVDFGALDEDGEMIWWHENGQVSSQGPYRDGVRVGWWVEYHPGGAKRAEGRYYGNRRTGTWTHWHPDGSLAERGTHGPGGLRVGPWERWRPGENTGEVAAANEPPAPDPE